MVGSSPSIYHFAVLLALALQLVVGQHTAAQDVSESVRALGPYYAKGDGDAITELSFHGNKRLRDADLKLVARLPQLKFLSLGTTVITDDGLSELKPLTHLKELHVNSTKVTDAGLAE